MRKKIQAVFLSAFFFSIALPNCVKAESLLIRTDKGQYYAQFQQPKKLILQTPKNNTVTTADKVSILGTCDPEYPLIVNHQVVQPTQNGFFALYVQLGVGENIFVFENNGVEETLTIVRKAAKNNEDTNTYEVIPAEESVQKVKKELYGVVKRNYVTHRSKPDLSNELLTPLAIGTTSNITGETEEYYKLIDNTYVYKGDMDIFEGSIPKTIISHISTVPNAEQNTTEIKFTINQNCLYSLEKVQDGFELTLYDAMGTAAPDIRENDLLESITWISKPDSDNATYYIKLKEEAICNGYDVIFRDGFLVARFKKAPVLEGTSLKGAIIVLDAGHGGEDSGALGPADKWGLMEKEINLAVTLNAKRYLEQRNATVILTRNDDTAMSLADRVSLIRETMPDISVSIHCNSAPITSNYKNAKGFLTLYSYNAGQDAQELVNHSLSKTLNFSKSPIRLQNLAMTRITNCPAMLIETLFLSNPEDYEWLIVPENQIKYGEAIGQAIEQYLLNAI